MGDLGILIIGVVDTFFAFFVVAPMMLQAASLFGVQKQFAKAMVCLLYTSDAADD